ncbi:hypothetical protein RHSIM_Rhsim01G0053500 [Rhododendron simsii]|uniref:EF-hand domain-containing protein n=1 Tax=Rhododendron simsii TaxID=118357 RepID=A0A834LVQ2_RHOSS|nr:hypothetical protein RHSIM_Rhsim01G0053500 [Rhododendron simsii]
MLVRPRLISLVNISPPSSLPHTQQQPTRKPSSVSLGSLPCISGLLYLCYPVTPEEIEMMISEVDSDGNEHIDLNGWCAFVSEQGFYSLGSSIEAYFECSVIESQNEAQRIISLFILRLGETISSLSVLVVAGT